MVKPGFYRGVPMAILGVILGALLVLGVRALQSMDPVWDPGVALVVIPFTTTWLFLWGVGAFDPRMSAHGEHHEETHAEGAIVPAETSLATADHHHEAEEVDPPVAVLGAEIWRIAFWSLIMLLILFAVAAFGGLDLRSVNEGEASRLVFETDVVFALPFGLGTFVASQLTVFLGFIIFTLFSLFVAALILYGLFYYGNLGVKAVKDREATVQERTPPWIVRQPSRFFRWLARGLRNGLPSFFGYKN